MMTRERELLQQALDALDRAISDDRAYIRECKDAAEAIRAHLAAQPAPVPLTDLQLSEIAASDEFLLYCSQDEFNEIARAIERAHGIAASPAAPAAPVVREPRHVRKVGGSFQHTGTVVAEFRTTAGEPRIVLEFDAPVAGMLHVYRPDQVEPCEPAAPAQAVPLTDTETHAELWKLAVRKGLVTVRSELIDPRNHGTRVSWMQGHDKACDISNEAAAHGIAASPEQPK